MSSELKKSYYYIPLLILIIIGLFIALGLFIYWKFWAIKSYKKTIKLEAGNTGNPGTPGTNGIDGKDSFEVWLENPDLITNNVGTQGTEAAIKQTEVNAANALPDGPAKDSAIDSLKLWFLDKVYYGTPGTTGVDGVDGSYGPDGVDGVNGVTGAQGVTGVEGPTGPRGEEGPMYVIVPDSATVSSSINYIKVSDIVNSGGYETVTYNINMLDEPTLVNASIKWTKNISSELVYYASIIFFRTSPTLKKIMITPVVTMSRIDNSQVTVDFDPGTDSTIYYRVIVSTDYSLCTSSYLNNIFSPLAAPSNIKYPNPPNTSNLIKSFEQFSTGKVHVTKLDISEPKTAPTSYIFNFSL